MNLSGMAHRPLSQPADQWSYVSNLISWSSYTDGRMRVAEDRLKNTEDRLKNAEDRLKMSDDARATLENELKELREFVKQQIVNLKPERKRKSEGDMQQAPTKKKKKIADWNHLVDHVKDMLNSGRAKQHQMIERDVFQRLGIPLDMVALSNKATVKEAFKKSGVHIFADYMGADPERVLSMGYGYRTKDVKDLKPPVFCFRVKKKTFNVG